MHASWSSKDGRDTHKKGRKAGREKQFWASASVCTNPVFGVYNRVLKFVLMVPVEPDVVENLRSALNTLTRMKNFKNLFHCTCSSDSFHGGWVIYMENCRWDAERRKRTDHPLHSLVWRDNTTLSEPDKEPLNGTLWTIPWMPWSPALLSWILWWSSRYISMTGIGMWYSVSSSYRTCKYRLTQRVSSFNCIILSQESHPDDPDRSGKVLLKIMNDFLKSSVKKPW